VEYRLRSFVPWLAPISRVVALEDDVVQDPAHGVFIISKNSYNTKPTVILHFSTLSTFWLKPTVPYPKKWVIRENWTMRLVSGIRKRPICTSIILRWFENFSQVNSTYQSAHQLYQVHRYPECGCFDLPARNSSVDFHAHLQDRVMKFNRIYPAALH
jgi:hypothetical protein